MRADRQRLGTLPRASMGQICHGGQTSLQPNLETSQGKAGAGATNSKPAGYASPMLRRSSMSSCRLAGRAAGKVAGRMVACSVAG